MTGQERDRLDVIESKVDTILVKLDYIEAARKDHETRLRIVERWKSAVPLTTMAAVLTGLTSLVIALAKM